MRAAVIGAGIMGSCTALALAQRGWRVTIFEARPLGHRMGSSHGRSRIVRRTYADPFYTEIMMEGYVLWQALNSRAGLPIFSECGMLYFGDPNSPDLRSAHHGLVEFEVACDLMEPDQVKRVFPQLKLHPGEVGLHTPQAGWVHADRAVRTALECAQVEGARIVFEEADPLALADSYDAVALCAGAWASSHVPWLRTEVTVQTFAYLETGPMDGPVWIEDGPDLFYGFPSELGEPQIKMAMHSPGSILSSLDGPREPNLDNVEAFREFAARRFGVQDAPVAEVGTCLYTRTADEDFRWGLLADNVYWVSPCSGHGFKFGPWIGERMADFMEGKRRMQEWKRFYEAG